MNKNKSRSSSNSSHKSSASSAPSRHRPPAKGGHKFNGLQRAQPLKGQASAAARSENQIPRDWRIVVGNHAINEALSIRPKEIKGLWLKNGWENSADLRAIEELARSKKIKIENKSESVIDKFGSSHQGAALFVDGAPAFDMQSLEGREKSVVLILDGLEDPHNLGAIVRTSWLADVQGILIPEDRAVGLTPTAHKVACGGAEHVPVEATTNFSKYSEDLKKQGYWIFGLSPRGKRSIFELNLPDKVVWAIGAEDKGLRVTTERLCDELVYIPQSSTSASYNASVATAMALTETMRQHAPRGIPKKLQRDE